MRSIRSVYNQNQSFPSRSHDMQTEHEPELEFVKHVARVHPSTVT